MTTAPLTASTFLELAREQIETRGWTQHEFVDADGRICAREALFAADSMIKINSLNPYDPDTVHAVHDEALRILEQTVSTVNTGKLFALEHWNDAESRTMTDILDGFIHAAKYAREHEEHKKNEETTHESK